MESLKVRRLSTTSVEVGEDRMWILGADAGEGALLREDFPITKFGLILLANSWAS